MHFCPNCNNIFDITKTSAETQNINFICSNCGYSKVIDPRTLLFSRTSKNVAESYVANDVVNMAFSDIIFRTRKYICSNDKCESHKDPEKREAIFFRMNNSYKVKYICDTCKTVLN